VSSEISYHCYSIVFSSQLINVESCPNNTLETLLTISFHFFVQVKSLSNDYLADDLRFKSKPADGKLSLNGAWSGLCGPF